MFNKNILFTFFLLTLGLGLLFIRFNPMPYSEITEYDVIARNLIAGNGYSQEESPPYSPDMWRSPGYVIFLYIVYKIFGLYYLPVKIIQAVLYAFVPLMIFYLSNRLFGKKIAYISSFCMAVYPLSLVFVPVLWAEILAVFTMVLGIFFIEKSKETDKKYFLFFSGLVIGYSLLVRPNMAILPLFISTAYLISEGLKKSWKKIVIFNFAVILIWSPWIVRNYIVTKSFIPLTTEGSEMLYWASVEKGEYFENFWKNSKMQKQYLNVQHEMSKYKPMGSQWREARARLFLRYAIDNIKEEPLMYAISAFRRIPRMWISDLKPSGYYGKQHDFVFFGGKKALYALVKYFTILCLLLGAYGLWRVRRKWKQEIFLIVPIFYYIPTHMFIHVEARYTLPARPFLTIFGVIGALSILERLTKKQIIAEP